MLNKLLNHIVVCMFALSAVTPISAMTAQRSGVLARAVARNSSLASKAAVSPYFQNASRVLQVARTHTTTPHTTSLLQRPVFNMQSLVRGATRSRIPDAHARALNLVQRRSFSMAPLINSISTDAVGIAVSAAAAAITWYMDDGVPAGLKDAFERKDAQAVSQWLATHELTAEEKTYVAQYCVDKGYDSIFNADHDSKEAFLALAEHVFAELIMLKNKYGQPKGVWFLESMARNCERAAKVFTPLAAQHFADLISLDAMVIEDIINHYAPAAEVFTPLAVEHFAHLLQDSNGRRVIYAITKNNDDALVAFTPAAEEHFGELITLMKEQNSHLIFDILDKNPAAAEVFTPAVAKHFQELVYDNFGAQLIRRILEDHAQAAKVFTPLMLESFSQLLKNYNGQVSLQRIIRNNPGVAQLFTPFAVEHFGELVKCPAVLRDIIESNVDDAAKDFTSRAAAYFGDLVHDEQGQGIIALIMHRNPQAAKDFTPGAAEHFSHLLKNSYGCYLLSWIVNMNPDAAQVFMPMAVHNFTQLSKDRDGRDMLTAIVKCNSDAAVALTPLVAQNFSDFLSDAQFLSELIYKDPKSVITFMPLVAENFGKLSHHGNGRWLIAHMMQKSSEAAAVLMPLVVQHFESWRENASVLADIVKYNSQAAALLAPQVAKHFDSYTERKFMGHELLNAMASSPEAATIFVPLVVERFPAFIRGINGSFEQNFLGNLIESSPDAVATFVPLVAEQLPFLIQGGGGSRGWKFLERMAQKSPGAAVLVTSMASENYEAIYSNLYGKQMLCRLIEINPAAAQDFMQAAEKAHIHDDLTLILGALSKHGRGEQLSPSEAHMVAHKESVLRATLPKDVQDLQKKVLMQEHALIDSGYAPFYHAQSKEKWFPIALDTFLHGVQTGEKVDSFYMMHTQADPLRQQTQEYARKAGGQLPEEIMYNYLKAQDAAQRVKLRKYGRQKDADRRRMLFLNGSLRGNATNHGSQSFPCYFVEDLNAGGKYTQSQYIMQNIFKDRGLGSVYEQFKDELQQLHEEYIALSKYGTLYQLAVPVDKVNEMVRPVVTGGEVTTIKAYGEKTDDMQKIISAMRDASNHPGDQNEFIATMTYDDRGLMNPKSGVKIKSYMIPKDDAQYAAWQAKWEDVKSRIKAAVESQRPADYVAPAHAQELVGLLRTAYEQRGGAK